MIFSNYRSNNLISDKTRFKTFEKTLDSKMILKYCNRSCIIRSAHVLQIDDLETYDQTSEKSRLYTLSFHLLFFRLKTIPMFMLKFGLDFNNVPYFLFQLKTYIQKLEIKL
jgi:hypothetical protein